MKILLVFLLFINYVFLQPCNVCNDLIQGFYDGLKTTEKSNFGGGNTAWEEERLGNFAVSETRLVHIIDNVCRSAESKDRCQYFLEEIEEKLEKWWFNEFRKNTTLRNLHEYLCINQSMVCCPNNHYGKSCELCKELNEESGLFCNGHGVCDGNGTRSGNGTCVCDLGYTGESCKECSINYFQTDNDSCSKCDISCEGCTGLTADDCKACSKGFLKIDQTCTDIDECVNDTDVKCNSFQFCRNVPGTYECLSCDTACQNCTESGADNCIDCADGYQKIHGTCEDINECSADSALCREPGQKCVNVPGSYECNCEDNYVKQPDGSCKMDSQRRSKKISDYSKTNSDKFSSSTNKNNKRPKPKKIWTRKFEREFFKLISCIFLLGFVSYYLGKYSVVVIVFAVMCAYYIYFKSIRLDQIFSKSPL